MSLPCDVYVNDAYRFIYVRARKVGGSSFVHAHNSTRYCTRVDGPATFNGRADCLREATPSDYDKWMNYTVIGHARNPWARAASSYTYINYTWSMTAGVRASAGHRLEVALVHSRTHPVQSSVLAYGSVAGIAGPVLAAACLTCVKGDVLIACDSRFHLARACW